MAIPAVTYSFSNGTTADASQVNQNFTDLINSLTDGTKSLTIDAITAGGTATFNGAVTLGNGSPDDITISGSLASSIPIKTNNSFDIGSATLGLAGVYIGASGGFTTRLKGAATSSYTFTFPVTGGSANQVLQTNGSGTTSWITPARGPEAIENYSISASVASNELTIALKEGAGSDPSSSSPVTIVFRNATATTGTPVTRTVTGALSIAVLSGATLGHTDGDNGWIHVYALDNSGTIELAVSSSAIWDQRSLLSTTAMDTSADSATAIYSTTARTSVPIRYLGRIKSSQTTAGTWASAPTEISIAHAAEQTCRSHVVLRTGNGHGSTNTAIRRFTTTEKNQGSAITYADSAANGASLTINEDGIYAITWYDFRAAGGAQFGFSLNSSELTTAIQNITAADRIAYSDTPAANVGSQVNYFGPLRAGDVVRPHDSTNLSSTTDEVYLSIAKVNL